MDYSIRLATRDDLEAIRGIYNHYVERSTCTFQVEPDSAADRLRWFESHTPSHPIIVAESSGEVVGWAALSTWNSRCAYARTVEASVYVRHDIHRHGIGKALLLDLIDRARALGHRTIIGGTCTEQAASLKLQASVGFVRSGLLREVGHKFGRWLDVAYTQLLLNAETTLE